MNTVQEIEKKDCTGCKLCESICPVHAVSFSEDAQGFWYPQVKEEVCIKCGKCVKFVGNARSPQTVRRYSPFPCIMRINAFFILFFDRIY